MAAARLSEPLDTDGLDTLAVDLAQALVDAAGASDELSTARARQLLRKLTARDDATELQLTAFAQALEAAHAEVTDLPLSNRVNTADSLLRELGTLWAACASPQIAECHARALQTDVEAFAAERNWRRAAHSLGRLREAHAESEYYADGLRSVIYYGCLYQTDLRPRESHLRELRALATPQRAPAGARIAFARALGQEISAAIEAGRTDRAEQLTTELASVLPTLEVSGEHLRALMGVLEWAVLDAVDSQLGHVARTNLELMRRLSERPESGADCLKSIARALRHMANLSS